MSNMYQNWTQRRNLKIEKSGACLYKIRRCWALLVMLLGDEFVMLARTAKITKYLHFIKILVHFKPILVNDIFLERL